MHDWNMWHGGGTDWMWWLMVIGIVLLWIGVIALVVWLVRTWSSGQALAGTTAGAVAVPAVAMTPVAPPLVDPTPTAIDGSEDATVVTTTSVAAANPVRAVPLGDDTETPRQILDRRYAAGEITRKDYLQRKVDLE